jgi:hypothetical protein
MLHGTHNKSNLCFGPSQMQVDQYKQLSQVQQDHNIVPVAVAAKEQVQEAPPPKDEAVADGVATKSKVGPRLCPSTQCIY